MDDFSPAAIARQVPATAKLLQAREQLANLLRYMDGKVAAEDSLKKLLSDPDLMAALKSKLDQKPGGTDGPSVRGCEVAGRGPPEFGLRGNLRNG